MEEQRTFDLVVEAYESRGLTAPEDGLVAKLAGKLDSGQRTWASVNAALDKAASADPRLLEGMVTTFGDGESLAERGSTEPGSDGADEFSDVTFSDVTVDITAAATADEDAPGSPPDEPPVSGSGDDASVDTADSDASDVEEE